MKGKILSVLFCLILVFGMFFAACDNGDYPKDPTKAADGTKNEADQNKTVLDFTTKTQSGVEDALEPPVTP
jgi:hypothetical protein